MSTTTLHKPTKAIARKVVETVNAGLVNGVGQPIPGQMCVEAAVCFAFGLPHGDNPPCVGEAVREFKIRLNDCQWSSTQARANGMKKLAVAQLGSDTLDQMLFGKNCYLRGVQKLMSIVLRKTAAEYSDKRNAKYIKLAENCEAVKTFEEAQKVANETSTYTYTSTYAYAYAYASISAYTSASAYASISASAYAYASISAWFKKNLGDEFLIATAEMGLGVLIEMKSPGCKWLDLCE